MFSKNMFPTKPLGRGKLGIKPFLERIPCINQTPPEDDASETTSLIVPFNRDLGGICLETHEPVLFPTDQSCSKLESIWREAGVPEHDIQTWLRTSSLGFLMSCIKNPLSCEPKSLIFWVGSNFKVGFDQRDGVNIFFLGSRYHLTIDLDDCFECHQQNTTSTLLKSRLTLLKTLASRKKLVFAIYRTDRGYHAIELSQKWDPTDPVCFNISRHVGGDTRYVGISALQGWRLRLSPKSKSPNDFVLKEFNDSESVENVESHVDARLSTLLIGDSDIIESIPEEHIQMMKCYLGLTRCISGFLKERKLESVLSEIMTSETMALKISKLVDSEISKWPKMYEQKLFDLPFKSYNLIANDL